MSDRTQFFFKTVRLFTLTLFSATVAFLLILGFTKLWQLFGCYSVISEIWLDYIKLITQTVIIFGLPVFICKKFDSDISLQINSMPEIRNTMLFLLVFLTWILCIIPVNSIWQLNNSISFGENFASLEHVLRNIQTQNNEYIKYLINYGDTVNFTVLILVAGVLPSFFEELFFRGYLQQLCYRFTNKKWLSIIVTAVIFSFFHFEFYAFLPRVLLGVLLGVAFYAARSLWLPMAIHFVNNFATLIFNRLSANEGISEFEVFGTNGYEWIISGVLFVIVIYILFAVVRKFGKIQLHTSA